MIKKLKVFFSNNKKGTKFKLQLTALSLSLILTGCNVNKNTIKVENDSSNNIITSTTINGSIDTTDDAENNDEINILSNYDIELSEMSLNIINSKFYLTEENRNYFQSYINDIDVIYPMSDYFQIDKFLEKYYHIEKYSSNTSKKIIKNNHINFDDLYNQVIKNNQLYLENNPGISRKYENTTNSLINKVCNIIVIYLNDYLENNEIINLNDLDTKLSELKIFESSSFSYAYFNPDTGILGVSSETVDSVKETSKDKLAFEKIIEHETNHINQACTIEELLKSNDYSMRFGPCYKFDDLQVNCGYWNWFFESTAESLTSKYNNTNTSLTYQSYIESLETIKTATVANQNNKIYDLEELSLQSDLEQVFSYFNCISKKDKIEIISLMYAFNIINEDKYTSSTNDFYELYKKNNNKSMDYTTRRILKSELASSIGITLSKQFYNNLSTTISNKEVKIEDIFQIISIFEIEMSKLTKYYSNYNNEYTTEFIKKYSDIQYNFFEIISNSLNISEEDIKNAYTQYNADFNFKELTISILSEEQVEFYEYIGTNSLNYKDISITLYNDYLTNNKGTKS